MANNYKYFKTGLELPHNGMEIRFNYDKNSGGYVADISVGERTPGMFGWCIDADYFNWYQKHQVKMILPAGRRSAAKEEQARCIFEDNVLSYAKEFAEKVAAAGGPKMTIEPEVTAD